MNSQELRALQEAYNQVYAPQELDEAEGSYGQTPKARQSMGALANKRRNTPASEYSERGEKTTKVKSAERHFNRMGNPDAGNRGKKSTKPTWHSASRKGMTQSDRDHARGEAEYGHVGYDPDWNGPASGPGGKPKGKKLERQKKTGVSAESFDLFDYILEHLVAEGYADTNEAAIAIMVNMSEEWREDIVEGMTMKDFKANRKKLQRRESSIDAEKRGHVSKDIVTHGRKYSPDEAKSNRANMSDDDRAARHRSAVDPDDDRDENTYSADKTKNPKKLRKQTAMGEH